MTTHHQPAQQDQSGSINPNTKKLVGNILLTVAAGWGITECFRGYPYACVGFALYAIKGGIGIATYFKSDDTLKRAYDEVTALSISFALPLFATEMLMSTGIQMELCLLNLVIPAAFVISRVVFEKELDPKILMASHVGSLICMGYYVYIKEEYIFCPPVILIYIVEEFAREKGEEYVEFLYALCAGLTAASLLHKKLPFRFFNDYR